MDQPSHFQRHDLLLLWSMKSPISQNQRDRLLIQFGISRAICCCDLIVCTQNFLAKIGFIKILDKYVLFVCKNTEKHKLLHLDVKYGEVKWLRGNRSQTENITMRLCVTYGLVLLSKS